MHPPQALTVTWARLIELLTAQSSELLEHIRPPAAPETVAEAEQRLQRTLSQDLRQLYSLPDGFVAGPICFETIIACSRSTRWSRRAWHWLGSLSS
jgi:cell wall assembly regulator SMI1